MATILVVEDTLLIRKLIATLLGTQGHTVVEAGDGEEGLRALSSPGADLIITDISMPNMDGKQLIAAVRDNPTTQHLPVVVLSADEGSETKQQMLNLGAALVIPKTGLHRELVRCISDLLVG